MQAFAGSSARLPPRSPVVAFACRHIRHAALSGLTRLPAEGFAGALAQVTGKPFGNCKSLADTTMVVVAVILQIAFLGGIGSFFGDHVVVREGTIVAAIGVGQIVKVLTRAFGPQVDAWLYKGDELPESNPAPAAE